MTFRFSVLSQVISTLFGSEQANMHDCNVSLVCHLIPDVGTSPKSAYWQPVILDVGYLSHQLTLPDGQQVQANNYASY